MSWIKKRLFSEQESKVKPSGLDSASTARNEEDTAKDSFTGSQDPKKSSLWDNFKYVLFGEDAEEKREFENEKRKLEKIKEERLKQLRTEEDKIHFEAQGPVEHENGTTSGRWELTCTGPGTKMNQMSHLISQSGVVQQMAKDTGMEKASLPQSSDQQEQELDSPKY